jgi:hypothetical protein
MLEEYVMLYEEKIGQLLRSAKVSRALLAKQFFMMAEEVDDISFITYYQRQFNF